MKDFKYSYIAPGVNLRCVFSHCVCMLCKVKETKYELNGLGDDIEEVRSVCRQLHSLLRQTSGCSDTPFEREAEALMDRWLDASSDTLYSPYVVLMLKWKISNFII